MSLLKWKELAKRKTELGNKINYVHNTITQRKIGEEMSKGSFDKLFKPVTSKLDDVIVSNLNLRIPQGRRPPKKGPDYRVDPDDEFEPNPFEDMDVDDLFGDYVPPQQEKQLRPQLPTYEDLMGEPQPGPQEPPPEYNEFEGIDYTIKDEDQIRYVLDELGLPNYEDIDYTLAQDIINNKKAIGYLKKMIKNARSERKKLVPIKSDATKKIQ